jgi:hypothetical protein
MCDCLKKSEENLIAHVAENLKKDYPIKEVNEKESGYVNKGLVFSNPGGWKLFLPFELKYTLVKKDGTPGKEKTYKTNVFPTYCPWCGGKMNNK